MSGVGVKGSTFWGQMYGPTTGSSPNSKQVHLNQTIDQYRLQQGDSFGTNVFSKNYFTAGQVVNITGNDNNVGQGMSGSTVGSQVTEGSGPPTFTQQSGR